MIKTITTLVVVIQNAILLEGVVLLVEEQQGFLLLGSATTLEGGVALCLAKHPNCVLLDLDMPSDSSLLAVKTILGADPDAQIIGLVNYELDVCVSRALALGVCAVVGKDQISQALLDTILRRSGPK